MLVRILISSALLYTSSGAALPTSAGRWRAATEPELRKLIPARAPVIKENIETEFRTASGVTDGRGKFIAGVVIITAGYSAEGKYSHFFITQTPLKIGNLAFAAGDYVFGYQRVDNTTIRVNFYRATNGESIGSVDAHIKGKTTGIRSLYISPPVDGRASIQIGRFVFDYQLGD